MTERSEQPITARDERPIRQSQPEYVVDDETGEK